MKNENEIKDENEASYFMPKMCDNSVPKMILGACCGAGTIARHSSPSQHPLVFFSKTTFFVVSSDHSIRIAYLGSHAVNILSTGFF